MKVGSVEVGDIEYTLKFPGDIPRQSGIYRLFASETKEEYVGETTDLFRRLTSDYARAGWRPERKTRTNRRIQRWIYELLIDEKSPVEVFICREASMASNNGEARELDLNDPHVRKMLEGLSIAGQFSNVRRLNL